MGTGTEEFFEDVVAGFWIGTTSLGLTASSLVFCFFAGLESFCSAAVLGFGARWARRAAC